MRPLVVACWLPIEAKLLRFGRRLLLAGMPGVLPLEVATAMLLLMPALTRTLLMLMVTGLPSSLHEKANVDGVALSVLLAICPLMVLIGRRLASTDEAAIVYHQSVSLVPS
jgi:hypothetical protein